MSGERVSDVNAASGAAQVAAGIRSGILTGDLSSGTPLREVSLAERFEVSRRTVREALRVLVGEGLVQHRHHQGATVRPLTSHDLADLYRVRRMLEVEAARCVASVKAAQLQAVDDAFEALKEAAESRGLTSLDLALADTNFHGAVVGLLGSKLSSDFYASMSHQLTRAIMLLQLSDKDHNRDLTEIVAEHQAIRDAIIHRDVWEAQRLIIDHLDRHERNILSDTELDD